MQRPNLYLVGFMGTGKSVIGWRVAKKLGLNFIDSDKTIERLCDATVSEIIENEGEAYFRNQEREFITSGHPKEACLISCGGGLITQEGIIEVMKPKGITLCLTASAETILERTQNSRTQRPLLQCDDPKARIEALLQQRDPLYKRIGLCISTDNRQIAEIVSQITKIYTREAKTFQIPQEVKY